MLKNASLSRSEGRLQTGGNTVTKSRGVLSNWPEKFPGDVEPPSLGFADWMNNVRYLRETKGPSC